MTGVKIGVLGCAGRMGQMLMRAAIEGEAAQLAAATVRPGHAAEGQDAGSFIGMAPAGVTIGSDAAALFAASEAAIDFTAPAATVEHAALARNNGTALIVGTTGFAPDQLSSIEAAGKAAPLVIAANTSLGVTILRALTERLAAALDDLWDIEIVEMHHRHKVDAPSGTALALGRSAAAGRGVNFDTAAQLSREGQTGARERGAIGFATLRGGTVFGDHSVIFAGEDERVELTHKVGSRAIFARGAVKAAVWAKGRAPGLYDMADVLGLRN